VAGRARTFVLAALVVVLAAGAALWWFVLRDDAPPKATLGDCTADAGGLQSPTGSWKVRSGTDEATDFVGYRIKELFGGATIKRTAAGRTADVTGTIEITGATVDHVTITADVTSLSSDLVARDTAIHTKGLQTDDFPEATFTSSGPVTLGAPPGRGRAVRATVPGELDLHGQKKAVRVPVDACWSGRTIKVSGSAPIVLADYGIEDIKTPIVKIDDRGSLEFQLTFVPA
jgi:polyisoprenoid-binding protein YceI